MDGERHRVFVYGTLTDPDRVEAVLEDWRFVGEAALEGLHLVDARLPTLAPGGSVGGRLLETAELATLDAYEGVDRGLYVRVPVPLAGANGSAADRQTGSDVAAGGETVWVFVGDPERLGASVDWPGSGSFDERVRRYVATAGVRVRRTANR